MTRRVFLNAYILSKGLVLADLPGLRDHNSARRNITERYIINCDEVFVVCNIGRALTDKGVEHVIKLARQARLSNVGIVCTRSDVRFHHHEFLMQTICVTDLFPIRTSDPSKLSVSGEGPARSTKRDHGKYVA
jgi:hypothetical protein